MSGTDPGSDAESMRIEEAQRRLDEAADGRRGREASGRPPRSAPSKPTSRRSRLAARPRPLESRCARGSSQELDEQRARGEGAGDRRRRGAGSPRSRPRPRRPRSGSRTPSAAPPRPRTKVADAQAGAREAAAAWLRGAGRGDPPRGGRAIAAAAEFDVAVVGGGAAGLWTALRAAEDGGRVCLISRTPLSQSASYWAQGGLAAALEPGDSPARHAADTIAAGRGLCRPSAVQALVEEAPDAVRELQARGVVFDLDHDGELALGPRGRPHPPPHRPLRRQPDRPRDHLEAGGDGRRRAAGSRSASAPRRSRSGATASAATAWSPTAAPIASAATVLATGGAAALWRRTTNPWGAIGAGPVLAAAAGADLADLEFCQFHPTALALPGHPLRRAADHRGGARRGGDAARRLRPPLHRRARALATRSPRRSSTASRPTARPTSSSTCAASTPRASPTSSPRLPRPASTPPPSRSRSPPPPTT